MAAEKPSFLGLLNRVSIGESGAGVFLSAWAVSAPKIARFFRFLSPNCPIRLRTHCRPPHELT